MSGERLGGMRGAVASTSRLVRAARQTVCLLLLLVVSGCGGVGVGPPLATSTPAAPTSGPAGLATPTARAVGGEPIPPGAVPTFGRATPPPTAASTAPAATAAPTADREPTAALTFDAGEDRGYAEDILDVLRDEHVPASFGITGLWAKANPDLVERMAADGHLIINHTLDHRSFTGLSDELGGLSAAERRAELEQADAIIAPLIGRSTRPWYRLPYGDDDARVAVDVTPTGFTRKVGWTVDSLGWRGLSDEDIVERCLTLSAPNAVYVLHVGRASRDGPALERIIKGLRDDGFRLTTVESVQSPT